MKKIALIILTMITIPTYATTMCAKNDTVAVIIDPSVGLDKTGTNTDVGTWYIYFPYGTMSGTFACINKGIGYSAGYIEPLLKDDRGDGVEEFVSGGERYGQYCWCRFTHPVVSRWVFYGQLSNCAYSCASQCNGKPFLYGGLSEAMFRAIFSN